MPRAMHGKAFAKDSANGYAATPGNARKLTTGSDGLDLCRRIRALPHGESSVVLVVTARDAPAAVAAALDAGADDYVAKRDALAELDLRLTIAERRVVSRAARARVERERAELAASHARLDGALKTINLVAHEVGNALSLVQGYGDLLPALVEGEAAEMAHEMSEGARRVGVVLGRLQQVVRFEETKVGGVAVLDLEAATTAHRTALPRVERAPSSTIAHVLTPRPVPCREHLDEMHAASPCADPPA